MKIITIEEHIPGGAMGQAIEKYDAENAPYMVHAAGRDLPYFPDFELFADVGEKRIADMDAAGIDMQVLSYASQPQFLPPEEAVPLVAEANDAMAEIVSRHPDRFAGFAALPWSNPSAAAKELDRAVNGLGLKGAILSGRASAGDKFLDDRAYWPVLDAASSLNVPVYMHPAPPIRQVQKLYYDGLGDRLSARLSVYGWGWHNEAGIQLLRVILSGTFDQFPDLQLIAGHWGEMVPFFLTRLDQALPPKVTGLKKTITEYFQQHIYVTPSGIFDYPQLDFAMQVLGADRIIHSVDFPFIGNQRARTFIEYAPISETAKEKIAYQNAERLLDL